MSAIIRLALLPFQGSTLFLWISSLFLFILLFNLLWFLVGIK